MKIIIKSCKRFWDLVFCYYVAILKTNKFNLISKISFAYSTVSFLYLFYFTQDDQNKLTIS